LIDVRITWFQRPAPEKVISSDEQIEGPFSDMTFLALAAVVKIEIRNHDTEF